jgi:acetyl-CoA acetyltransferase
VLSRQLDPYYYQPLWPDSVALAGLQARAMLDSGDTDLEEMAAIAHRNRTAALGNPHAQLKGSATVEELLASEVLSDPLRRHDCPPISDGACAVVLAAGDRAREWSKRPAWIRGLDHRIDSHNFGARDLGRAPSIAIAAGKAGATGGFDVAELHAPFTHQEVIVRRELALGDDVVVNPSGGPLAANPMMAAGLLRIGEVAARISAGEADRGVAHATSGQLLQQNLVCVLEGE